MVVRRETFGNQPTFARFGASCAVIEKNMDAQTDQRDVYRGDLERLIQQLGSELNWPKSRYAALSPNMSLDRDLGLDSLTRVELIGRVERKFHVNIGEKAFLSIETIDDLIGAIANSAFSTPVKCPPKRKIQAERRGTIPSIVPHQAQTLIEVLEFYELKHPNRLHLSIFDGEKIGRGLTYAELATGARRFAAGLIKSGLEPGRAVAIMLPTGADYFFAFMGCIMAGGIPVPIYPPTRPSQLDEHLQRHSAILRNCQAKFLVSEASLASTVGRLLQFGGGVEAVKTPEQLMIAEAANIFRRLRGDDVAFLQYTSGSTGNPKGVILTHKNLLANIRAMGSALDAGPDDVFVSWLPLYHDMGLIGAWLGSFYYASHFIVMSPFSFLSRPIRWLEVIQNYGGTLTAAPNFAYEFCVRHVSDDEASKLDLGNLRAMCNGAEAIHAQTVLTFSKKFKNSGLNPRAIMPVYGLAESSVGLAFPPLQRGVRIDSIRRRDFEVAGIALPCEQGAESPLQFVGCGQALSGHEIRIVDDLDHELPERREGHIQFRGPSSTQGYLNREEENKKIFHGPWIDTGDLGYFAEGDLFVTGRVKDLIKHAGRNVHPEEIEMAVGGIPGVRKGCVVAFGVSSPREGTEHLVVLAETRETDAHYLQALEQQINEKVSEIIGGAPDRVILTPPHVVLKTSSGKIRRSASKELYVSGRLESANAYSRLAVARYLFSAVSGKVSYVFNAYVAIARSFWVWFVGMIVVALFWPLMVSLPSLKLRWRVCNFCGRLVLAMGGVRLRVFGHQSLEQCVYVANHASYVDVVVLAAALKNPVTFVAKAELKRNPGLKFTLDRLGVIYVERQNLEKSIQDAKETTEAAHTGKTLFSFPEGTFTRKPGLLPFHLGPFLTAIKLSIPVIPVSLRGTRSILHPDSWLLRPGDVALRFGEPIIPELNKGESGDWALAVSVRERARAQILKDCGEVDLS